MKAYIKEIPGRAHDHMEDSSLGTNFSSHLGNWGLYMIADGLSGYNGTNASHSVMSEIKNYLEKTMTLNNQLPDDDMIHKAILKANEKLEKIGTTRSTLDLVLTSDKKLYLSHLGDSRIYLIYDHKVELVTSDECLGGQPTNFLGSTYIDGKGEPIEKRIKVRELYGEKRELHGEDYPLPKFIFLTTDGLTSRATNAEIEKVLLSLSQLPDPSLALDQFEEIVRSPREKLRELTEDTIVRKFLFEIEEKYCQPKKSKDELIDLILNNYTKNLDPELVGRLDRGTDTWALKFDDTTMVLVDLEDKVSKDLSELTMLRNTEPSLRQDLEGWKEKFELSEQQMKEFKKEAEKAKKRFDEEKRRLGESITEEKRKLTEKTEEYQTLSAENMKQVQELAEKERRLAEKEQKILLLNKEITANEGKQTELPRKLRPWKLIDIDKSSTDPDVAKLKKKGH